MIFPYLRRHIPTFSVLERNEVLLRLRTSTTAIRNSDNDNHSNCSHSSNNDMRDHGRRHGSEDEDNDNNSECIGKAVALAHQKRGRFSMTL